MKKKNTTTQRTHKRCQKHLNILISLHFTLVILEMWKHENFNIKTSNIKTYYEQRPGNSFKPTLKPGMIIGNMYILHKPIP